MSSILQNDDDNSSYCDYCGRECDGAHGSSTRISKKPDAMINIIFDIFSTLDADNKQAVVDALLKMI